MSLPRSTAVAKSFRAGRAVTEGARDAPESGCPQADEITTTARHPQVRALFYALFHVKLAVPVENRCG